MIFKTDSSIINNKKYTIFAFSVMGDGKLENQDSFDYYLDDSQIIIAVADGLGSATFSKEGSSLIVKLLLGLIRDGFSYENIALELLKRWKNALNGNLNLYDTTIKFVHLKGDSLVYGGIGDGWIALNYDKDFISMTTNNTFSNQTDSILSFDLKNKFSILKASETDLLNIIIATDGFSEDIEKDSGKQFLDDIYNQIAKDHNEFKEDIMNTMTNWPIKSNKDDKTVVFLQREEVQL